jgi:hypothetical protein
MHWRNPSQLLDTIAGGDRTVLPAGHDPNEKRKPR